MSAALELSRRRGAGADANDWAHRRAAGPSWPWPLLAVDRVGLVRGEGCRARPHNWLGEQFGRGARDDREGEGNQDNGGAVMNDDDDDESEVWSNHESKLSFLPYHMTWHLRRL